MMWRIMQIEEEHAIDWVLPTSASKYGNRVAVVRIKRRDRKSETVKYWISNIGKKQDFKLVAPSNLTPLLPFKLNYFREKGITTKWFLLVKPLKYAAPQYYSPCATDLQRAIFIYFL